MPHGEVILLEGGSTGLRHQQPLQQQQSARRRAVVSHISAGIWGAALILALLPHAGIDAGTHEGTTGKNKILLHTENLVITV